MGHCSPCICNLLERRLDPAIAPARPRRSNSCKALHRSPLDEQEIGLRAEARFMLEVTVASLLHRRVGYERVLNGEVPEVVYLDGEGRLFSAPVLDGAATILRFKLIKTDLHGAAYSLQLHHRDCQFTASHREGAITLRENGGFSPDDSALLEKLLRHLEKASRRTLGAPPQVHPHYLAAAVRPSALVKSRSVTTFWPRG